MMVWSARQPLCSLLRNCGETVALLDARPHWPSRKRPREGDEIFPGIWCPRRDIDKRCDLGVDPYFAEDGATPRMGNQHGRAILRRQCAACRSDRICECGQRILPRGDLQARRLKARDNNTDGLAAAMMSKPKNGTQLFPSSSPISVADQGGGIPSDRACQVDPVPSRMLLFCHGHTR